MNTFDLTLDLDKSAGVTQWVAIRQGDKSGTTIRATIYDHGTALSGNYTARICMRLPDGTHFYEKDATLSGNVATVTIDETQAASVSGLTHNAYFQIIQGSTVVASTQDFTVKVLRDAMSDAEVGENYSTQIEQAIDSLNDMTSTIPTKVKDEVDAQLEAHPEWTTTVQDNSLTDAKLIQHGGILDRVARLWHRLDNLLTATPAEADALTVTDAAKTPLAGLALYGRSTQSGTPTPDAPVAIQSVTPNLAKGYAATATNNGITYVTTEGGATTISGTASGGSAMPLQTAGTFELPAGTYTLVMGGELTASGTGARAQLVKVTGSSISNVNATPYTTGGGTVYVTFTTTEDMTAFVRIGVNSGSVVSGTLQFALYEGSVAYPPVPYGNVGLWARGVNLWSYGNHTFTRYVRVNFDTPFPAGTYTVSALVTSADTDASTSTFTFRDANDIAVGSATLTRNSRASDVVTIARPATYCYLYSSTGAATSTGDEATWADIQVEQGSTATAYQPYAESTTPISLQGHALRSLPDGTRDEVTVDQYGHATLIQRVGEVVLDGSVAPYTVNQSGGVYQAQYTWAQLGVSDSHGDNSPAMSDRFAQTLSWTAEGVLIRKTMFSLQGASIPSTASGFATWLQSNPVTLDYKLPAPVTIDLGTIDPVALQGPDMTAQSVPTAPFALTYERDLNVTLARLEAAIAEVATS